MASTTLRVVGRWSATDDVVVLTLADPAGHRLRDWAPGAHVDVVLAGGLVRQYSLCGDRFDPRTYRVAVRRERDGRGGSAHVHDRLAVGDLVGVGGPRNTLPLVPAEEYLFLAGGIGITPLLPMVAQAERLGADWHLAYAGRSRSGMPFLDELPTGAGRVSVHASDEGDRLDVAARVAGAGAAARIYCCGPASMVAEVERAGAGRGAGAVRTERFSAPAQDAPVRSAPFEVVLARSGRTVVVDTGTTVLQAIEAAGGRVLSSCGQGLCGTCETTVLDGVPDHRDSVLDADERAAGDCLLVCVSRSCSDRLVLDA
ncbi:2Fe-2S iron-sulfur cluster binding domain-containing protein [Kineococcus sp. R8]|nr:2Fe-2S iron-sulfur cluster binding domain-containing protein [Kineococcus siccus]